jgi:dimethylamine/trimethylamine dehydrogenase
MKRNPRYDILFEPVKIGPVTAPNRFYQTPHAIGTGQQMPHTRAAMREVRAEGGWGVINTGYCSIHPSSDDAPLPYCRLWDNEDIKVHELMVNAVHKHGSLAGVELWHGGSGTGNRLTREPSMSASGVSNGSTYPGRWTARTFGSFAAGMSKLLYGQDPRDSTSSTSMPV